MKFQVCLLMFLGIIPLNNLVFEKNHYQTVEPNFLKNNYEPDYSQVFKYEYPKALDYVKENSRIFNSTCCTYKIDTALAISIIFPEFIRYSNYRDILETYSLEVIYINLGKEYIDFSIGLMQMKPSFVEKLENYIKTSPKLSKKYKIISFYNSCTEKEIRAERINRLKSIDWQIFYLCLFCDVVSERFNSIKFNSKTDKISFYSAAYNADFLTTELKINNQIKKKNFPYGKNWFMPQYSYSDVAVFFYNNYFGPIR